MMLAMLGVVCCHLADLERRNAETLWHEMHVIRKRVLRSPSLTAQEWCREDRPVPIGNCQLRLQWRKTESWQDICRELRPETLRVGRYWRLEAECRGLINFQQDWVFFR